MDVCVVGAGVAGSTAARELAGAGLGVLLVDRAELPRHKVCGCCLNAEAVGVLREAGLGGALVRAGASRIDRVVLRCRGRTAALASVGGLALSRYALDGLLLDAARQAGCAFYGQTSARISTLPSGGDEPVSVELAGSGGGGVTRVQAGVVLVADGLAGSCVAGIDAARRVSRPDSLRGYGAQLPGDGHGLARGEVVMRCGGGGYVGSVVLEDGSLDIAAAMRPGWVKSCRGPGRAAARLCEQAGQGLGGLEALQWRATAPLTGRRARPWLKRVFFLGDAAGYVEPFTGEGMAWAMRSALAVVPYARQAARGWHEGIGPAWEKAYRDQVQRGQRRCRLFSAILRRPTLVSATVIAANLLPGPMRRAAAMCAMPPMFGSDSATKPPELSHA